MAATGTLDAASHTSRTLNSSSQPPLACRRCRCKKHPLRWQPTRCVGQSWWTLPPTGQRCSSSSSSSSSGSRRHPSNVSLERYILHLHFFLWQVIRLLIASPPFHPSRGHEDTPASPHLHQAHDIARFAEQVHAYARPASDGLLCDSQSARQPQGSADRECHSAM